MTMIEGAIKKQCVLCLKHKPLSQFALAPVDGTKKIRGTGRVCSECREKQGAILSSKSVNLKETR